MHAVSAASRDLILTPSYRSELVLTRRPQCTPESTMTAAKAKFARPPERMRELPTRIRVAATSCSSPQTSACAGMLLGCSGPARAAGRGGPVRRRPADPVGRDERFPGQELAQTSTSKSSGSTRRLPSAMISLARRHLSSEGTPLEICLNCEPRVSHPSSYILLCEPSQGSGPFRRPGARARRAPGQGGSRGRDGRRGEEGAHRVVVSPPTCRKG